MKEIEVFMLNMALHVMRNKL